MSAQAEASTVIVKVPSRDYDRVYLYCPAGHEVVSSPTTNRCGQRLVAGDYSGESCGHGSCGWEGPPRVRKGQNA